MAKKTNKRRYTPRQTRKFQLRQDHPVDLHVAEILDFARSQRRAVTMIRDGVRLLWALENDDLSVLFDLFPHLEKQFIPDGMDLLEQFRRTLLERAADDAQPTPLPPGPEPLSSLKPLLAPVLNDDDDQDTIILKPTTSSDAGMNFLGSLGSYSE